MTKTITSADRLTILKLLAGGRDIDFTATATSQPRDTVLDVAKHHGYPDRDKLAWAVDVLAEQLDDEARASIPTSTVRTPAAHAVAAVPASRPRPAAPAPDPQPAADAPADVAALIALGKKSTRARTRGLAEKAEKALAVLRKEVTAEVEAKKAAATRAAEEAKVRSEVERLEAELAAVRARLPKSQAAAKTGTTALRTGADPKTVRAWARTNGIDVPAVGRVPNRVMDAYAAAHAATAA